ncbi:hypothetical protein [Polymorphospora sp. NPDC050346]|uniref:hypothetical protein n=1 Tax=Polymorphospora sp. NPDC050346 TaxID=3155780 RepID=UPI0033CF556A
MTINPDPYRDESTPPEDLSREVFELIDDGTVDISPAEIEARLNRTLADSGYALESTEAFPSIDFGVPSLMVPPGYHSEVLFTTSTDATCLDYKEGFKKHTALRVAIRHAREKLRRALVNVADAERRAADVTSGADLYVDIALDRVQEQKVKSEEEARRTAGALIHEAKNEAERIIAAAEQKAMRIATEAERGAAHAYQLSQRAGNPVREPDFRAFSALVQAQARFQHLQAPTGSGKSEASMMYARQRRVQLPVEATVCEFMERTRAGLHLEKPAEARDPRRTVRIDQFYRGVVVLLGKEKYVLLCVLPHDDAIASAVGYRFAAHQNLGLLQMRNEAGVEEFARTEPAGRHGGLFDHVSTAELLRLGVDENLMPLLRNIATDQQIESLAGRLPEAHLDILRGLASGMTVEDVWGELADRNRGGLGPKNPLTSARCKPEQGTAFVAAQCDTFPNARTYIDGSLAHGDTNTLLAEVDLGVVVDIAGYGANSAESLPLTERASDAIREHVKHEFAYCTVAVKGQKRSTLKRFGAPVNAEVKDLIIDVIAARTSLNKGLWIPNRTNSGGVGLALLARS